MALLIERETKLEEVCRRKPRNILSHFAGKALFSQSSPNFQLWLATQSFPPGLLLKADSIARMAEKRKHSEFSVKKEEVFVNKEVVPEMIAKLQHQIDDLKQSFTISMDSEDEDEYVSSKEDTDDEEEESAVLYI